MLLMRCESRVRRVIMDSVMLTVVAFASVHELGGIQRESIRMKCRLLFGSEHNAPLDWYLDGSATRCFNIVCGCCFLGCLLGAATRGYVWSRRGSFQPKHARSHVSLE